MIKSHDHDVVTESVNHKMVSCILLALAASVLVV